MLVARVRAIAQQRTRYGYRRAWATLRQEGARINPKRVYRVWRAHGLGLPRRAPKKRHQGAGTVPDSAARPGHGWTYDFVHDACTNGRPLKMLAIIDEFTRESVAIATGTSWPARQVIEVLARLFHAYGSPEFLRSDNGPEFIAREVKSWLREQGAATIYIDPGCPWQNAYGESFNGKFRDECLNLELFRSPGEAQVTIERWRQYYNTERPHSSLGYLTPVKFKTSWLAIHQP
jgi:putative transposase